MAQVAERIEVLQTQRFDETGPPVVVAAPPDVSLQPTMLQGDETAVKPNESPVQWTKVRLGPESQEQPVTVKRPSGSIRPAKTAYMTKRSTSQRPAWVGPVVVTVALVVSALLALLVLR
jgi:hypothetical protein